MEVDRLVKIGVLKKENCSLLAESFTYERLANEVPTKYKTIQREQQKDKQLLQLARKSDNLRIRTFHGGGKSFSLICEQTQIVVPTSYKNGWSNGTMKY